MIEYVISGGQTGADYAGVEAARLHGIKTGGWMPAGFRTLKGPRPEYYEKYGMREHTSYAYPPRTRLNVKCSDATLRFATNFDSAGEKCTARAIEELNKLSFDIHVKNAQAPEKIARWINGSNVKILNVAGNSEETSPGIEKFVIEYLLKVFAITNPK